MAVSSDPAVADDYVLYVTASAPADAAASKLSTNYTQVGLANSINLASAAPEIETRFFGGTSTKYGSNKITGTIGAATPVLTDDGAEILTTAHEAQPKTLVYFLLTTGVTGSKGYYGSAYVGGETLDLSAGDSAGGMQWTLGVASKTGYVLA